MSLLAKLRPFSARTRLLLLMSLCVVVFGSVLFLLVSSPRTPERITKRYYQQQFKELGNAVDAIPSALRPPASADIQANVDNYDELMGKILGSCARITGQYSAASARKISPALKENLRQSNLFCSDLTNVAQYSQNIYRSSRPYLVTDSHPWPAATSTVDFNQRLSDLTQTTGTVLMNLDKVDNSKVQDPAKTELSDQLTSTVKLCNQVQDEFNQSRYDQADVLAKKLLDQTSQYKKNFLLARNYYWNNTVQLAKLQAALRRLSAGYN